MTMTFVWSGRLNQGRRATLAAMKADRTFQAPLVDAVLAGEIAAMWLLFRSAVPSRTRLRQVTQPMVILIGDDDLKTTGSSGWSAADTVLRWAGAVIVHAARGEAAHYVQAVELARTYRRVALVETASLAADDWIDAARAAGVERIMHIAPRGGVHPLGDGAHARRGERTLIFTPDGGVHEL
jgi:hypothetical protein